MLGVYENPEERSGLLKALLERGGVTDHEIRLKTGDGRLLDISVSAQVLRGPDGTLSGVAGTLRNITRRKEAEQALRESEEALHEQARRDPLTGVLNHGAIVGEISNLVSDTEHAGPWAVAMIDVNRMKVVNDTYGHQVGDAVLVAVATALSRGDALVGRYGGDEFVAILPGADKNAAERYRKDATDALAHATIIDPQTGASVAAEASIGLAIYPEDGATVIDLIKVSDAAMYAAKRQRPVSAAKLPQAPIPQEGSIAEAAPAAISRGMMAPRGLWLDFAELALDGAFFRRRLAFALATGRRLLRTRARLTIRRGADLLHRLR